MTSTSTAVFAARNRSDRLALFSLFCVLATVINEPAFCASPENEFFRQSSVPSLKEPENTGWSIQLDNDAFHGSSRDQDYTGGLAITFSGRRVLDYRISVNKICIGLTDASARIQSPMAILFIRVTRFSLVWSRLRPKSSNHPNRSWTTGRMRTSCS